MKTLTHTIKLPLILMLGGMVLFFIGLQKNRAVGQSATKGTTDKGGMKSGTKYILIGLIIALIGLGWTTKLKPE